MESFPVVLSPNLGCPVLVALDPLDPQGKAPRVTLRLLVADPQGRIDDSGVKGCLKRLSLTPSYPEPSRAKEIELIWEPQAGSDEPREGVSESRDGPDTNIKVTSEFQAARVFDWNELVQFERAEDTMRLVNKILHYQVLGDKTTYWECTIKLSPGNAGWKGVLRPGNAGGLPTLYDLVLKAGETEPGQINYHAVQFVQSFNKKVAFAHLTDLHVARRNDEILHDLLHVMKSQGKGRDYRDIESRYRNFNDDLRAFINHANGLASEGKLDFVVMTGDLVDFVFHQWEETSNDAENNWRTFIDILTGRGKERERGFRGKDGTVKDGNPGLKVACFTSTGNHDWRTRPYNPFQFGQHKKFGLCAKDVDNYRYRSYDPIRHGKRRAKLLEEIEEGYLDNWELGAFKDLGGLKVARLVANETGQKVLPLVTGLMGFSSIRATGLGPRWQALLRYGVPALAGAAVGLGTKLLVDYLFRKKAEFIMDNPLHADPMALHYYLKHVNPYLDYAFSYGWHSFIVMDSGCDVFLAEFMDRKSAKHIHKMSFNDNVLGGSPDSRAFDSEKIYYNWSQIVWLEKVLTALNRIGKDSTREETASQEPDASSKRRIFVFLHAPPLNTRRSNDYVDKHLRESRRSPPSPRWIRREEDDLTFGTLNHYISEFLYLCLGRLEREVVQGRPETELDKVDVVFSGHAHRDIEFRLKLDESNKKSIRIYCDRYSESLELKPWHEKERPSWWDEHRPLVVQTPACGLKGKEKTQPPHVRIVTIESDGDISGFQAVSIASSG